MFVKSFLLINFIFSFDYCSTQNPKFKRQVINIRQFFNTPGGYKIKPDEIETVGGCGIYCDPITGLPSSSRITQNVQDQIRKSWEYANRLTEQQRIATSELQKNLTSSYFTTEKPKIHNQNSDKICGYSSTSYASSYILGGEAIQRGEWPWLVAFYRGKKTNLEFICGASLISNLYVISAAHCVQDKGQDFPMLTKNGLLFLGKHNLIQWNEFDYQTRGTKQFKIHPDWKPFEKAYDGDISLIEMESPVVYSSYIRPICLWEWSSSLDPIVGRTGIVAGWGKNEFDKINTEFPKKINVPIVSESQCLRSHPGFTILTSSRNFCAGGNGENPCKGDSGGGLILNQDGRWYLRGIVSAGLINGQTCYVDRFTVFTDVAKFLPWIKANSV